MGWPGPAGPRQDFATAAKLDKQACDNGAATGCAFLGAAFAKGTGVDKDLAQAATFFERACPARLPRRQNRCDDAIRLRGKE
jgi:TPR repeat protein